VVWWRTKTHRQHCSSSLQTKKTQFSLAHQLLVESNYVCFSPQMWQYAAFTRFSRLPHE